MRVNPDDMTGVSALVVDDVRLCRDNLVALLDREPSIVYAEGVPDAEAALRSLRGRDFAVVLLSMRSANSLATCRDLVASPSCGPVVALAVSGDDDEVVAYAEAGVSGYLLHDRPYSELLEVIASVARGETPCPPRVVAALMRRVGRLAAERHTWTGPSRLTPRERRTHGPGR